MLDEGRKHGIGRFCQVSTDEVYGDIDEGVSVEEDRFLPNSPYAASKAGGELMVRAYAVTYGMDTVISRGSNTYGPYQYPEKLIPFFTTEAIDNRPLPLYGDGRQIRDWLYVDDHARGVDRILHDGESGEAYNLAGENQRYNVDVTRRILKLLGKPESLIRYVPDREGHDRRYAMSAAKARASGLATGIRFRGRAGCHRQTGTGKTNGGGAKSKRANTLTITSGNMRNGLRRQRFDRLMLRSCPCHMPNVASMRRAKIATAMPG